jgi:glycosyltransferase involved in cell wall biosynthesis
VESLRRCLDALAEQTLPASDFEVIVVDDGSTDGTYAALSWLAFPFQLVLISIENSGPSVARNIGMARGAGSYIALTEDDVIPRSDWLECARKCIQDGAVDVVEGRTVYEGSGETVRRFDAGGLPSFIPCNLFVKREVLTAVGGYDPAFFDAATKLYFREDADFGFRLMDRGCRVFLADDVVVSHPRQFRTAAACIRHARRYFFDPLLARKHPERFRALIEVKRIAGLRLRRVQHLIAVVHFFALLAGVVFIVLNNTAMCMVCVAILLVCAWLFWFKYRGRDALRMYDLRLWGTFLVLPLMYVWSVVRGSIIFRSWRALIW